MLEDILEKLVASPKCFRFKILHGDGYYVLVQSLLNPSDASWHNGKLEGPYNMQELIAKLDTYLD